MVPGWTPLSTLFIGNPPILVTPSLARRLLSQKGRLTVRYAGDRMWPALRHGQEVEVFPLPAGAPRPGQVVLAAPENILDILRVRRRDGDQLELRGDADPVQSWRVSAGQVLGATSLPARRVVLALRILLRTLLDVREALTGSTDDGVGSGESVKRKYDGQASFYRRGVDDPMESVARIARLHVVPGGEILVAGSGTGRECFILESLGFRVSGVDFSHEMVTIARAEGERRGASARFIEADLIGHAQPNASLDGILFTFDVYSFIPGREARVTLLARMARWLRPNGVILLSARRLRTPYEGALIMMRRLAGPGGEERLLGASHTRYITMDGNVSRSFIKVFTVRALRREIERAGLRFHGGWDGGHLEVRPRTGS